MLSQLTDLYLLEFPKTSWKISKSFTKQRFFSWIQLYTLDALNQTNACTKPNIKVTTQTLGLDLWFPEETIKYAVLIDGKY